MMVRIWLWNFSLLAIAVMTASVQIDRQSATQPALANIVPEPFRGFAQAQIASAASQDSASVIALEEAEKLVARRPMPAEALRLLAQAQMAAGKEDAALITIQVAAKRGWRDPTAQEAMMRLALGADDKEEAARRYIALFLQNSTSDALLIEVSGQLFSDRNDPAPAELVQIVAASRRWQSSFLRKGSRVIPVPVFLNIVSDAQSRGAKFDCRVLNEVLKHASDTDAALREQANQIGAHCQSSQSR